MMLSRNFYEFHCCLSNFIYNNQFLANFEMSQSLPFLMNISENIFGDRQETRIKTFYHTHTHTLMHARTHAHAHTHTHTHTHVCMHVRAHTHMYAHMHIYMMLVQWPVKLKDCHCIFFAYCEHKIKLNLKLTLKSILCL